LFIIMKEKKEKKTEHCDERGQYYILKRDDEIIKLRWLYSYKIENKNEKQLI